MFSLFASDRIEGVTIQKPPSLVQGHRTGCRGVQPHPQATSQSRRRMCPLRSTVSDNNFSLWTAIAQAVGHKLNDATSLAAEAQQRMLAGFQPPPPGFPDGPSGELALELVSDPLRFLNNTSRRYGSAFSAVLAGQRVVIVSDPQMAREVLIDKPHIFGKDGTALFPGSSLTGNGLLTSDGEVWRRQRKLTNPAFRRAAILSYTQVISARSVDFVDQLCSQCGAGGSVEREVYAEFNELTLRMSMEVLFGSAIAGDTARAVSDSIRSAFSFFARRQGSSVPLPEWIPTPDNLQFKRIVQQLDHIVYDIIQQRRAQLAHRPTEEPQDLLDVLLLSRDEAGDRMDTHAVRDELMTLIVASQETSAIVLSWTCALLAHHPTWQARVTREVRHRLHGRTPTLEDLRHLPALECSLLESLRVLPPAYMIGRCANADVHLGQYVLPKGASVLVSPYLMQRDAATWGPQSLYYRPQRWSDQLNAGGSEAASMLPSMSLMSDMGHNGAYMPFGAGPRNCIGTGFAMLELMIILATLLQRFDMRPPPGAPFPQPNAIITLRPSSVPLCFSAVRTTEGTPARPLAVMQDTRGLVTPDLATAMNNGPSLPAPLST